jgi:hypothetical protein
MLYVVLFLPGGLRSSKVNAITFSGAACFRWSFASACEHTCWLLKILDTGGAMRERGASEARNPPAEKNNKRCTVNSI